MKTKPVPPRLVMCATLWSMIGFPSAKREWPVAKKVRAIQAAGFDGVCAFITPEIKALADKLSRRDKESELSAGNPATLQWLLTPKQLRSLD